MPPASSIPYVSAIVAATTPSSRSSPSALRGGGRGFTTHLQRADATVIAEILQTLVPLARARPGNTKGMFVR